MGNARLLRRYARARALPVAAMQCATDGLQQLFGQPDCAPLAALRNWGLSGVNQLPALKHWLARQAKDEWLVQFVRLLIMFILVD